MNTRFGFGTDAVPFIYAQTSAKGASAKASPTRYVGTLESLKMVDEIILNKSEFDDGIVAYEACSELHAGKDNVLLIVGDSV